MRAIKIKHGYGFDSTGERTLVYKTKDGQVEPVEKRVLPKGWNGHAIDAVQQQYGGNLREKSFHKTIEFLLNAPESVLEMTLLTVKLT